MALKQKHYACIELMLAHPNWSIVKLAEETGVNRNTMRNLADEGDFKASKYILDSLGYAPTTKIEADVSNDIFITIG